MSIVEVAKLAGVSTATVSRLINKTVQVSPDKAKLIRAAMERLGYTPSARRPGPKPASREGLRTGQILLLSVGSMDARRLFHMPAFPAMLAGVERALAEHGLHLIYAHYDGGGPVPRAISPSKADGVLVMGTMDLMPPALREALRSHHVVWTVRGQPGMLAEFDHVVYDNEATGPMAADYFLARGHRHMAFLNPAVGHPAFVARRDGFVATARQAGVEVDVWSVTEEEAKANTVVGLERIVREFAARVRRPTALFVPSDDYLLSVFHAPSFTRCDTAAWSRSGTWT
jgi:DNA-binding LacI/PurR family transcriptional regulator